MSAPYSLEAFLDLLGPLADTKPKLVALTLVLAYITYRFIQQFTKPTPSKKHASPPPQIQPIQQNDFTCEEKHPPSTQLQEYDIKEEPNDIDSKLIPISKEMLTICNCEYQPINGVYRWFLATAKWCFFTDDSNEHFALQNNIDVNRVYTALQTKNISFEWDKSVLICWVISDINNEIIYYAAPQISKEYLPKNNEWIAVKGNEPMPQIFANWADKTDEKIRNVFRKCDGDHTGVIGRDKVMEGFKILGYNIDNISVLNIMPNDKDVLSENAFCMALEKYISDIEQQNIVFNLNKDIDIDERMEDIKEETDGYSDEYSNEDNGVIVHKEIDTDEDEDDSISDLEDANDDDDDDGSISDLEGANEDDDDDDDGSISDLEQ